MRAFHLRYIKTLSYAKHKVSCCRCKKDLLNVMNKQRVLSKKLVSRGWSAIIKETFYIYNGSTKRIKRWKHEKEKTYAVRHHLLIMVFVMAVPMTVSADTATHVNNPADLQTAVNAGGEIVLDDDITASITIPKGKNITLDLNGEDADKRSW